MTMGLFLLTLTLFETARLASQQSTVIDIEGIHKLDLLRNLWRAQKPAAFFTLNGVVPPKWDIETAKQALHNGYIDYLLGRAIKNDLSGNTIELNHVYDETAGLGVFARIIEETRAACL